jgi:hypothetical protein
MESKPAEEEKRPEGDSQMENLENKTQEITPGKFISIYFTYFLNFRTTSCPR